MGQRAGRSMQRAPYPFDRFVVLSLTLYMLMTDFVQPDAGIQQCKDFEVRARGARAMASNCSFLLSWDNSSDCDTVEVVVLSRLHSEYMYNEDACRGSLGWSSIKNTVLAQFINHETPIEFDWCSKAQFFDTCSSPILTTKHLQQLRRFRRPPFFVLGPALSSEVAVASPQLAVQKIPHMSPFATSELFDDPAEFPYLFRTSPSDHAIVQGLSKLIQHFNWSYIAVVASAQHQYGTKGLEGLRRESISSLCSQRPFCIGQEANMPQDPRDLKQMSRILQRIQNDPKIRVIVLFTLEAEAGQFLACMRARNMTSDYVVLGTEAWITRTNLSDIEPACACCIVKGENNCTVSPSSAVSLPTIIGLDPWTLGEETYSGQTERFATLARSGGQLLERFMRGNPWFAAVVENRYNCTFSNVDTCLGNRGLPACPDAASIISSSVDVLDFRSSYPVMLMFDVAIQGVLYTGEIANRTTYNADLAYCFLQQAMVWCSAEQTRYLPKDVFACKDGKCRCRAFTSTRSAWPLYHVLHITAGNGGNAYAALGVFSGIDECNTSLSMTGWAPNVTSSCRPECRPGQKRASSTILSNTCCWSCVNCTEHAVSNGTSGECSECKQNLRGGTSNNNVYTVSNAERTECITPQTKRASSGYTIAQIAVRGAVMAFILLMLAAFIQYRNIDLIHSLDLKFTCVVFTLTLVGLALTTVLLVLEVKLEPTQLLCGITKMIDDPFIQLSPAIVLIRSLNLLAQAAETKGKALGWKHYMRSTKGQLVSLLVVLGISELIAVISLACDAVELELAVLREGNTTLLTKECREKPAVEVVTYVWQAAILFPGLVAATLARNKQLVKGEGMMLFTTAVCLVFVIISVEPATALVSVEAKAILQSFKVGVQLIVLVLLLYGSRLYLLVRHRKDLIASAEHRQSK
eukprot:scpid30933/ scgid22438/ Metabotropic glutamate receptor